MLLPIVPSDLIEEMQTLYDGGLPAGTRTGWPDLDQYYTVAPGYWTVITGVPSHGKSTWLDGLMVNLMRKGWKFIVYSPENQPLALHMSGLFEKLTARPFRRGYNNRLEPSDIARCLDFFDDKLRLMKLDGGKGTPNLRDFMTECQNILVLDPQFETGNVGIVIDPWNELDHSPINGMNETQFTNYELMEYRQWIRNNDRAHGFIVSHPAKPQRGKNGEFKDVTLYDINGSAAWYNKCDHGIVVVRRDDATVIDVQKCRFRHLGAKGQSFLQYNSGTGNFYSQEPRNGTYGRDEEGDDS